MQSSNVVFRNGSLKATGADLSRSIPQAEVRDIIVCRMEDNAHHGEETFHLLVMEREFLLVGPFVEGGLAAMEALQDAVPNVPVKHRLVRSIPYSYREPGLLGLRLFPVPGLFLGPISDLERFQFQIPEVGNG